MPRTAQDRAPDRRRSAAPAPPAPRTPAAPASQLVDLVAEHGGVVLAHAVRWTSDHQAAEDVVQETWIRAWRHRDRLVESRGSVRSWLLTVAHHVAVDRHRGRRARPAEVAADAGGDHEAPGAAAEVDAVLDRVLAQEVLARAAPPLRAALVEVYLHDRTVAAAADRLGVPVGTVKSRLHYGIRQLRAEGIRQLRAEGIRQHPAEGIRQHPAEGIRQHPAEGA